MFHKAFQTAFVCLRCQSRLLRQQSTCSSSVRPRQPKSVARLLSTAVARAEEEEDNEDDYAWEDAEVEVKNSRSGSLYLRPTGRKISSDQYHKPYRKFHPDRVADLGVSSLGKRAEVLVLQPRDRYIPRVPTEDEGQKDPQLLEALQAETAPLDPEQVKHNIEQIKKPFGSGGQILDEARWKELRHNLVKGFTHVQLLDYIRDVESKMKGLLKQAIEPAEPSSSNPVSSELSRIVSDKLDLKKAGRNRIKRRAAVSIMKDVWGFLLPAGKEEAEDVQSVTVSMSRYHIGALKAQMSQPFIKLSGSLKVKIDIFQGQSKIVVHGRTDAVEEARKALISLRDQVASLNIDYGKKKYLLPSLRDAKYEQRLLEEVGRNRPIQIERKNLKAGPSVRMFYHQSDRQEAEAARRDILLAGKQIRPRSSISVWPQLEQQSTWLVPYTSWQALPWWERLGSWGRWRFLQQADTKAQNARARHEGPVDALATEVSQWLCNANTSAYAILKSEPVTYQNIAVFGQALFRRDIKQELQSVLKMHQDKLLNVERHSIQHPNHPPSSSSPRLVADVPLLAQSLALCKPWSVLTKDSIDSRSRSTATRHFTHRLLLQPAVAEPYSPPLQVYLRGEDSQSGLRQPLCIHSVSAVFEESSHILLLPDHAVDVEFRRQTLYHVYTANRKKNPKHGQFLDQFLHYLNQAQGQEVPAFATFVMLNLPRDLTALCKRIDFARASTPKEIEPLSGNADVASPASSAPWKSPRKSGATEYMLAASETVDAVSFSHGVAKDLCLDHIQFSARDGQSRQELRLAERPYPDTEASSGAFSRLLDSAFGVASWLGDPKLLKEGA